MKNLKRIFCLSLVMALIFTLPGMTHIVSAATRETSETDNTVMPTTENQIAGQPLEAVSSNRDLTAEYESGIWKQSVLTNAASEQGVMPASELAGQTPPDMMYALRKVNPVFSSKNNSNENIDLNTGSLNLSYPLASMAGVNGMDLSLSVNYSSASSNTREQGYTNYYLQKTGYVYITYIKTSTFTYLDDVEYEEVIGEIRVWKDDLSLMLEYLLSGPHINENPSNHVQGTIEEYEFEILDISEEQIWVTNILSVEKPIHTAESGLGYGWQFNIPYIKSITSFDENGNQDYSYKTIVLDNGQQIGLEDDEIRSFDRYYATMEHVESGYTYTASSVIFNGQTATHILSYKDGMKYYFDANDRCLGKEDRFGNQIFYAYTSSGKLSAITDNYGRYIRLTWYASKVTISASDGTSVDAEISNNRLVSITYNNTQSTEKTTFSYIQQNAVVGNYNTTLVDPALIPYHLLTEISYPNGIRSSFVYVTGVASRPGGCYDDVFQIKERYDTVNGEKKNTVTYQYSGCYLSDYQTQEEAFFEEILQTGITPQNIWEDNGIELDYLAILSYYSTTVSDGISTTTYHFNPNGYCNSIEVRENNYLLSVTESLYDGRCLAATYETILDAQGDAKSYFTQYHHDRLGNVISTKKFQNGNFVYYEETATYNNPYSLITSSSVNGITTNYTYSSDNKTLSSVEVKEGETLREKTEYTYLTNGNIQTEKVYIYPQGTSFTKTYTYDNNNLFPISTSTDSIKDADGAMKDNIVISATYDIAGKVLSETDGNGNTTSYTYDLRGRLIRTDYADGTYETVTYQIANRKTTNRNRAGYTQINQYDENGNLLNVKESDGTLLASYTYDIRGRVVTERIYQTSSTWRETRYTYDALDRPLAVNIYDESDNLLSSESYVYDVVSLNGETFLKTTKTVLGDSSTPTSEMFEYTDVYGRTVRSGGMFDGEELAKTFTYDNLDRVLTETDELGKTTRYTYDYAGNVLTAKDALNGTITYTYDSMGNILTMTDALGSTVTYTYDVLGRQLTQTVPFTASTAQVTKYDYDANGNVTITRVSRDSEIYTRIGNLYDEMNRLLLTVSADDGEFILATSYTYNAYDKPLTMKIGNSTTVYEYNQRGEQIKITDAMRQNETFSYDLGGNLVSKTDRNGTTFTYVYDRLGRLLSETAVNGNKTEGRAYAYSLTGALVSESNGTVTITRKYDVLGRLIEETETSADGTAVSRYAYTKRGEKERYALNLNGEEIISEYYEYDDLGRLWKVYESTAVWAIDDGIYTAPEPEPDPDPDPNPEIVYTNDFAAYPELPIYTICALGDSEGMRYRLVPLEAPTDAFPLTYTKNGTLYGVCFEETSLYSGSVGSGDSTVYVYYNNVLCEQYHISFNGGLSTALYGYYIYDENNNVAQSVAITAEDFDSEIPTFEVMVLDDHIDFGQYIAGYSLRSAGNTETLVATYAYDANGNRIGLTYANGTTTTYAYNQANLVTSVVNKKGNTTLSSHTYTYYLDGNIASENENGTTKTYEYDGLGRLTKETKNGTITSYTYDLNGNRATMTQNGVTTAYEYDANNRLLKETVAGAVTSYDYDNNGNLINAWNAGNPVGAYAYNLFGNQISFTADSIVYTNYTYRPDGLRHSIGDKVHVWDGANIVADVDGNDVVVYIRGINLIYANDGVKTYYHFNAHGDVVVLTNESGNKTKSYSYNAFGVEYNEATLDDNPFRYCGEYYDKETKTIYLRARYYNAEQGRFTQEDTHWNVSNMIYGDDSDNTVPDQSAILQSGNLYAYCSNNPIIGHDPYGTVTVSINMGAYFFLVSGASYSFSVAIDDDGNIALQKTKADVFKKNSGAIFGLADIGGGESVTLSTADTVFDLEGPSFAIGGSTKKIGAEVFVSDLSDMENAVKGVTFSVPNASKQAVDFNVHATVSKTETIASFNIKDTLSGWWREIKSWFD